MAQPGVAREPSMEEILASIRKIIESNDPGAEKSLGVSVPPLYDEQYDDEISLTIDEDNAPAELYAANDRPIAAPMQAPAVAAETPARSVSLADLAARVRATVEREDYQPAVPASRQPQPQAQPQIQPSPDAQAMPSRLASMRTPMPAAEPAPRAPQPDFSMSSQPAMMPSASERSDAIEETAPASGLLSAESGALVARSFGELAAVVDGQQRRSLDEMAEEMLRPMLREWLDDNLPTLVERLVREEIERVARGPRR
ncbi:PopZ family protein [Ciceribacter sp. L1K22]|uniref:PopZ family protein n=1 Tax=Ciceribacter sp. L1K22 TaxID=2820275 RepID=UPI001ABEC4EF|nr:PopZ family protein [Ciceribacter sp. L1K22]MBO3760049.1 PopZ family protein [Ciceribacter sp. L1K22]